MIPTPAIRRSSVSSLPGSPGSASPAGGDAPPRAARPPSRWRDVDVLLALSALWVVSVIRVAGAAAHHEVFGAEATLAFLSMFAIPWMAVRARFPTRPRGSRPQLRLVGRSAKSSTRA